jgi:hypothetical protein
MLLYDTMLSMSRDRRSKPTQEEQKQIEILERAEVILANNVAHFFYVDSPKDEWDTRKDFPNIAPPFGEFFIEWESPSKFNSGGKIIESKEVGGMKVGMLFSTYDPSATKTFSNTGVKWVMQALLYLYQRGSVTLVGGKQLAIMSDGSVWNDKHGDLLFWDKESNVPSSVIDHTVTGQLHVALLALSLMHCKNVELKTVIPPAPLSKKYQKKTGRPLVRYKILEIEPMKKVLRTEGQSDTMGLKHALHICRGHFKDYSKGGGLFGKLKGLYWWDSHVRGDPAQGAVVKDYNVNPPSETPS